MTARLVHVAMASSRTGPDDVRRKLALVDERRFESGVVRLRYCAA